MSDFGVSMRLWVEKAKGQGDLVFRGIVQAMTERIKELTPVDTGRLRASIQPNLPVEQIGVGDVVTIGTNVEYARRIEYGFVGEDKLGRHYNQPGHHMFAQTATELPEIADKVVRKVTGS